jgi:flagellar hook-associated protein 2
MAGPVTFGGFASGMNTNAVIDGLVNASSVPMRTMQRRANELRAAVTTLSDIGRAVSSLRAAAHALSNATGVGSFTATSSSNALAVSALPTAAAGSYSLTVDALAQAQRTYTASFDSRNTALGMTGDFTIQVGDGDVKTVSVEATDTLDTLVGKINQSGARVGASVFTEGGKFRIQVRGLDTGAANAVTFVENGTTLDLNGDGSVPTGGRRAQTAADARVTIDGFTVTSATNQVSGAIPGVTLAVKELSATPVTVTVEADANAVRDRVRNVAESYNRVIQQIQRASGWGSNKAQVEELAGDSALRSVASRLSAWAQGTFGEGALSRLATIGLSLTRDGTLQLDDAKLRKALTDDAQAVTNLLARPNGAETGGAMANLRDMLDKLGNTSDGTIGVRANGFTENARRLDKRAEQEQARLDRYAGQLRKQFAAMEEAYSKSQAKITQLSRLNNTSG